MFVGLLGGRLRVSYKKFRRFPLNFGRVSVFWD